MLTALLGTDLNGVVEVIRVLCGSEIEAIEAALASGSRHATRVLDITACNYIEMVDRVGDTWRALASEPAELKAIQAAAVVARHSTAAALSCEWVRIYGAGAGAGLFVVEIFRTRVGRTAGRLPQAEPGLEAPPSAQVAQWRADFWSRLEMRAESLATAREGRTPLHEIKVVMDLGDTDLARLFGVTRQAVQKWLSTGAIPSDRIEPVDTLRRIARTLETHVKRDRIPSIVRRKSDWFEGRSILDAFEAGERDRVLARVREVFDWSAAA